ncbi:MAG TPA: hypothetical protein VFC78_24280 [Tepidisphaeraceae bacterium]|nr:hypothetical protein [Tepidisphaeraceae bacterium]
MAVMAKAATKKRGRPAGSVMFTGGVLAFAVSKQTMEAVGKLRDRDKLPSISDAARRAIDRGLRAEKLLG